MRVVAGAADRQHVMSPETVPFSTKRFTAAMTKDGRPKVRAPFVVPAFDGRSVFVELKTGKVHARAYVVFVGVSVSPEEALSKVQDPPADRDVALSHLRSFIEQVAQFKLGNVLVVERGADGLPLLSKIAEHPVRELGPKLPG